MTHLHFDCFSGISGDMCLGALVDAGVPLSVLKKGLKQLQADGYQLKSTKVLRGSIHSTKVEVHIKRGYEKPLSLKTIRRIIKQSTLPAIVKTRSLEVFHRLAEAEGIVHGLPEVKVHFHEVGVIDSLVDIVGTFLGLHHLRIASVSASPLNVGSGTIQTEHGLLPVPGPAVAQLGVGIPIYGSGPALELTTPTGIGILSTLTQDFRSLPLLISQQIGYGAGDANPPEWPNVLRLFLSKDSSHLFSTPETIVEIQTTIDDLSPQVYESMMEHLFEAGALDVTLTPVIMKRSRPGIILTVLSTSEIRDMMVQILFRETTTLGLRIQNVSRHVLPRKMEKVKLPDGIVQVKVAELGNGDQKMMPEYRDCQAIAKKTGKPVQEIMREAFQAFHRKTASLKKPRKSQPSS